MIAPDGASPNESTLGNVSAVLWWGNRFQKDRCNAGVTVEPWSSNIGVTLFPAAPNPVAVFRRNMRKRSETEEGIGAGNIPE